MSTTEIKEEGLSIKEAAAKSGLSQDTLRFYEKEGLLFPIHRLPNGHRRFFQQDLDWLDFVLCLRSTGMPHSEIMRYKQLLDLGDKALNERREILVHHRESILRQMKDLESALGSIEWKIENHYKIDPSHS